MNHMTDGVVWLSPPVVCTATRIKVVPVNLEPHLPGKSQQVSIACKRVNAGCVGITKRLDVGLDVRAKPNGVLREVLSKIPLGWR